MNKIISYDMKLKSFSDDLLNKFTKSVEENYWSKKLRVVISRFVWLRNNHSRGSFEIVGPMFKVNTHISYINEVVKTDILLENRFEIILRDLVRTRS